MIGWASTTDNAVDDGPEVAPPGHVWLLVILHDLEAHAGAYARRSAALAQVRSEMEALEQRTEAEPHRPLEERIEAMARADDDFGGMSLRLVKLAG